MDPNVSYNIMKMKQPSDSEGADKELICLVLLYLRHKGAGSGRLILPGGRQLPVGEIQKSKS